MEEQGFGCVCPVASFDDQSEGGAVAVYFNQNSCLVGIGLVGAQGTYNAVDQSSVVCVTIQPVSEDGISLADALPVSTNIVGVSSGGDVGKQVDQLGALGGCTADVDADLSVEGFHVVVSPIAQDVYSIAGSARMSIVHKYYFLLRFERLMSALWMVKTERPEVRMPFLRLLFFLSRAFALVIFML